MTPSTSVGPVRTVPVLSKKNLTYLLAGCRLDGGKIDIEIAAPNISEPLTWTQICERFPDQWVVLVEVDWVEKDEGYLTFEFHSARVATHGTRREALMQARPLRVQYPEMAHYFTGEPGVPLCGLFVP